MKLALAARPACGAAPLLSLTLVVLAAARIQAAPAGLGGSEALSSLVEKPGRLIVVEGAVTVDRDLTVPAGRVLRVEPGGRIEVAAGKTLTLDCGLQAGAYRIFWGAGKVAGDTQVDRVRPEWFYDGKYNDEGSDWSAAINTAIDFAAGNCRSIFLGSHVYNVNRTVNLSSTATHIRAGLRLEGALRNTEYNLGTTLLGNTGSGKAILEATDSDGLHVINLALRAGTRTPSTIGLLQARGVQRGWGGDHCYENLYVSMGSQPEANDGAGTIGVLNLAAEETRYQNLQVWANLPFAFTWTASLRITNPGLDGTQREIPIKSSLGLALATDASNTEIALTGLGRLIALDHVSPVVLINNGGSVDLGHTFMQRRGTKEGSRVGSYDAAIENWNCYQFRHMGGIEGIATYLLSRRDFAEAQILIRLAPAEDATQPLIQLYDDGGTYQLRNVSMICEAQGVERPLILYRHYQPNPQGDFKIRDCDFRCKLKEIRGVKPE